MSRFRGAWQSLNFYKEYLFGFATLVFATSGINFKIAQSHTCQKWPAIESEWGRMKERETTSVQENVVLANIKALDLCMCGCMYTRTITLTHTHIYAYKLL